MVSASCPGSSLADGREGDNILLRSKSGLVLFGACPPSPTITPAAIVSNWKVTPNTLLCMLTIVLPRQPNFIQETKYELICLYRHYGMLSIDIHDSDIKFYENKYTTIQLVFA